MTKLPTKPLDKKIMDKRGSEFVPIPILPHDIFIGSVEDLSLHFHMEIGDQGKLSNSTAKFPTWISIFVCLGIPGSKEEFLQFW